MHKCARRASEAEAWASAQLVKRRQQGCSLPERDKARSDLWTRKAAIPVEEFGDAWRVHARQVRHKGDRLRRQHAVILMGHAPCDGHSPQVIWSHSDDDPPAADCQASISIMYGTMV